MNQGIEPGMPDRRQQNPVLAARIGAGPREGSAQDRRRPAPKKSRPFAPFEWMIALRYLRPKRKNGYISVISILSLLGIMIGVAALIIVMAVMNGFRQELLGKILGIQGHMVIQSAGGPLTDYDRIAKRVRAVPGVAWAAPMVEGQVIATANGGTTGVLVRGIRTADLASLGIIAKTLSPGALTGFATGDEVIVGERLANAFRLAPGSQITLVSPRGDVTPFGTTPRVKAYTVAGTFKVGMSEYDSILVFMPFQEARLYFDSDVTSLQVMLDNPDRVMALAGAVGDAAGPFTRVAPWQDSNSAIFGALTVERNVMFLILTLIIVVAALNIISSLIMLVKDKGGDIAILRTMGASRGAVMRIFFISGASIGVIGTLLGFAIGVAFCANIEQLRLFFSRLFGVTLFDPTIYFLSQMPAKMETHEVVAVVLMSLTLSFLATLYPSWRAARLDPVEALRYE